jgi:hypothetical protein
VKKSTPQNFASLRCAHCASQLQQYERWANNSEGFIFLVEVDDWPMYFLDIMEVRMEFCGPACVIGYMNRDATT